MNNCWSFDNAMCFLSTCHVSVLHWMTILFNLVIFLGTALFKQLINIARFIETCVFVACTCVRVCIVQSNISRIPYILPFTISYCIQSFIFHSQLFVMNLFGNEFPLITKHEKLKI